MPPKSASARSPSLKPSSTAGKSIPRATRKSNSALSPATMATATAAAVATSPDDSRKINAAVSLATECDESKSSLTTTVSQAQFVDSDKTTVGDSRLVESDKSNTSGNFNAYSIRSVEAEKSGSVEDEKVVGSGDGDACEKILSQGEELRLYGRDERSSGPPAEAESGASGMVGSGNGKKKIVKRTVRVVRKVLKRVPKNVLKDCSENQENVVLLNEVTENLNLRNRVNGNSDLICDVMEKSNLVEEEMKKTNLNIDVRILDPVISERGIDLTENDSVEACNFKSDDRIADVDGRYYVNVPNSMEVENVSSATESTDKSERTKGVEYPVIEKVSSVGESLMVSDSSMGLGGFMVENALKENWIVDNAKDEDMEQVRDQKVGKVEDTCTSLLADHNEISLRKTSGGNDEGNEKVNPAVEGDSVQFNDWLLLSGELEALERKKRRKTEIFVGGLNKDAKEDDVRDVFKMAGEIVQVRLAMNSKTGKNKGFAFVRFATAVDAKNALEKFSKVEICGTHCDAAAVEGNDTIFLGNIDRKWKTEDVVKFLGKAGVEKIEVVTLKSNPKNTENNRGFAFVEFETNKDAQIAFHKLKKKNVLGNSLNIKIEWATPLIEPSEEEILKVKSVYVEFLPSSWDEEKVKEYFKRFGEIENVVLAKDLVSSRRKDFAFINYSARDAALTCIEAVNRERVENGCSEVKMAASLANPTPRTNQRKPASNLSSKQLSQEKPKTLQATMKIHELRNKGKPSSSIYDDTTAGSRSLTSIYDDAKVGSRSSTTDELVQILRQQASGKHVPRGSIIGTSAMDHHFPFPRSKRQFPLVEAGQPYLEPRALPRARLESSYSISGLSALSHGVSASSFPYDHDHHHHHHQEPGHTYESIAGRRIHSSLFQKTDAGPYQGNSNLYHRWFEQ